MTANVVLVKDGSGSVQPSLQQLGWKYAAVRDQHREPLASFSCVQVEDRPELQGWTSSISCAEDGMFLLFLHPVHYCSAVRTVGPSQLAPQNGAEADNRKYIPEVGAGEVGDLIFSFVPLRISPVTKCREGNSPLTDQSLQANSQQHSVADFWIR